MGLFMICYGFDRSLVVLVSGDSWRFLYGADFGSFVAGLVVVFGGGACGGDARGGWCCFLVRVNGGFCGGQWW